MEENSGAIDIARELLASAKSVAVLTGAGISAESGIPTFRGAGGLWRDFKPEDLATPDAFARDPQLVWEWYLWRRGLVAASQPNAAHFALASLQKRISSFTLITQNVDGLHDRAGSRHVLKIHGDIWLTRCTVCRHQWIDNATAYPEPPRCPKCASLLRPGVVWFGESLPKDIWDQAQRAVCGAQVLLVAGTSAQVFPAAGLIPLAERAGARTIEVNLDPTSFSSSVSCSIRGLCGEILPQII